jgi:hypothetical protein
MKPDIRLTAENLAQYARHNLTRVNFEDLKDYFPSGTWHGLILDTRSLNAIECPLFYWKRGTLRPSIIEKPRLYIASPYNPDIGPNAKELSPLGELIGFRLKTENVAKELCYWDVEPIYEL